MDSKDLQSILNEPLDVVLSDISKLQRLVIVYQQIYGKECASCGGDDKYKKIFYKLKDEGLSILQNMENATFLFKKTVKSVPMEFGSSDFLTPLNLTDERAIQFLTIRPNLIVLFQKFPDNWRELTAKKMELSKENIEPLAENNATPEPKKGSKKYK